MPRSSLRRGRYLSPENVSFSLTVMVGGDNTLHEVTCLSRHSDQAIISIVDRDMQTDILGKLQEHPATSCLLVVSPHVLSPGTMCFMILQDFKAYSECHPSMSTL